MGQKSAVASQMKKIDGDRLIVPPSEVYEHAQSLLDPIARRAYELFESRGGTHGHDLEDWCRAEAELLQPVNVELSDSGDALLVIADVAGYRPEDLRVSVEPQSLRICGRSSAGKKVPDKSEEDFRRFDGFFVSFDLPAHINSSQASANITQDDLLKVLLPKLIQPEVGAGADMKG